MNENEHNNMFRAALYVCAQCGGAIAGAALVYGIHGAHDQFEEVSELFWCFFIDYLGRW